MHMGSLAARLEDPCVILIQECSCRMATVISPNVSFAFDFSLRILILCQIHVFGILNRASQRSSVPPPAGGFQKKASSGHLPGVGELSA